MNMHNDLMQSSIAHAAHYESNMHYSMNCTASSHELNRLKRCPRLACAAVMSVAGTSSAARLSMERLLDPPNLLRRAAVALATGVGKAVLAPLTELADLAEGVIGGRPAVPVLPTCTIK